MTQLPLEDWYTEYKPLLFSIAYRMLGSVSEAEDIIHDLFLAVSRTGPGAIQNPKAYLCKSVTRRCIDQLKSARARREVYVGPWLPEPLQASDQEDPLLQAARNDDISFAFLLLLEQLNPVERAIFVLREAFDYDYKEIADMLDKSEAACRKTYSRLKQKLNVAEARSPQPGLPESESLVRSFLKAVSTGDVLQFIHLLTEDAVLYSDGGGKARAALRPILGANRIAAFLLGIASKGTVLTRSVPVSFNRGAGLLVDGSHSRIAILFEFEGTQIRTMYFVNNPDKLRHLPEHPKL
ncbi:RNA polymerase sigma-70 factor [Paenibacillus sp. MZ04-78.2]|uniref:RNA polymerase sigma-70 factor n=1 Tax=Paenibacillus sp. MZ04-78.2 TaxID=2962034 RepID=UPI0020B7D7BF|nr:RNA polymerase sigma-70 factor [Paenibacillus sp. MZ04-78.2]MCP3773919.1 RNA polymerase sigma-70 factor [Paenibacillus sp. MZ04-78.2]